MYDQSNRELVLKRERALVLHVWDHIVQYAAHPKRISGGLTFHHRLATLAQNVVVIGQAAGCHAIVNLLNERSKSLQFREYMTLKVL